MPRASTRFYGELDYSTASVFCFPRGLPGFEEEHAFVFLNQTGTEPLVMMQSLSTSHLCFILLPVLTIAPDYSLRLGQEELVILDLPPDRQPGIGTDVLCAALICTGPDGAHTANLMAPIVVNLRTRRGIQTIQAEEGYSHRHPLDLPEMAAAC
jgi:flagellar assembly factor FliW